MTYILYTLFTILFVYYQKYQFLERNAALEGRVPKMAEASKKWHTYGMILRVLVLVILATHLIPQITPSIYDIVLAGAINVLVFEFGINKIALGKDWFYVGTTAETDKKLGKKKWIIMFGILFLTLIAKIISLF
jgi:hypothetical protein